MRFALFIAAILLSSPAMALCAAVGDSIAVGMGGVLRGCRTIARVGAGSGEIAGYRIAGADFYLNSVGTNDNPGGARGLLGNIAALREVEARTARRIVWFVPRYEPARSIVAQFAAQHGDPTCSADRWNGFHPAAYGPPAMLCLSFLRPP